MAAKKKPAAKPDAPEEEKSAPAKGEVVMHTTVINPETGESKRFAPGDKMSKEWAEHCSNPAVFAE